MRTTPYITHIPATIGEMPEYQEPISEEEYFLAYTPAETGMIYVGDAEDVTMTAMEKLAYTTAIVMGLGFCGLCILTMVVYRIGL